MSIDLRDTARLPADFQIAPDTLRGRVVLIVGAAGALGRASALACAQAGARVVVLLGRRVRALEAVYDEIEKDRPGVAAIYPLDLAGASPKDYDDLAQTFEREYGRLDGVVFAAAHFEGLQPALEIRPEDWLRTLHVNLTAPYLLLQACAPLLRQTPAAQTSAVFAIDDPARVGKAFWGAYGASKHALLGLVSILHQETENSPLRVHALLPAPMRSALRRAAYFGEDTTALPTADGAAAAVVYLLSGAAAAARGRILDLR